jgi:hypothetical protein
MITVWIGSSDESGRYVAAIGGRNFAIDLRRDKLAVVPDNRLMIHVKKFGWVFQYWF